MKNAEWLAGKPSLTLNDITIIIIKIVIRVRLAMIILRVTFEQPRVSTMPREPRAASAALGSLAAKQPRLPRRGGAFTRFTDGLRAPLMICKG